MPTKGLFGTLLRTPPPYNHNDVAFKRTPQGSDEQVDSLASVTIFVSAMVMLIAPLWVLAVVESLYQKLGVITAFLLVFLAILAWGTLSKPFEILAATAG